MHADKKKKKKKIYIYIYIYIYISDLLADLLYSEQMSLSNLTTVIFLSTSSKYFLAWWSTF